ncbi:Para-Rep C9 [Seminavis robusta]|uniref:Para-Rep C9 n=1 Tax=Seminavis robusta TaxID=568900 RepID=A0A9N8DSB4_9STRA|nr:Para-Rep C9 [Seminavis robusta]|eukprot:Sro317_g115820.1 Para-Rep C9 (314) ;mRNA; r:70010-70951
MKGNPEQNLKYCTKEESRVEGTEPFLYGEIPKSRQGHRTDLDSFKEDVQKGIVDWDELLELHSSVLANQRTFSKEYIAKHRKHALVRDLPLRPFQNALLDYLQNDPHTPPYHRQILFIVDPIGDSGKSWFAAWYFDKKKRKTKAFDSEGNEILEYVQIQEPGKKADMALSVSEDTTVMFIDVTRQQIDTLQYSTLEAFKNKLIFCSKYNSNMKRLSPMHVVVLMNQMPNFKDLSKDRYLIWQLQEDHTHYEIPAKEISVLHASAQEDIQMEKEIKEMKRRQEYNNLKNGKVYPPFRRDNWDAWAYLSTFCNTV